MLPSHPILWFFFTLRVYISSALIFIRVFAKVPLSPHISSPLAVHRQSSNPGRALHFCSLSWVLLFHRIYFATQQYMHSFCKYLTACHCWAFSYLLILCG